MIRLVIRFSLLLCCAVQVAQAHAQAEGVQFADRRDGLPLAHVYSGGWEHFVGGGLAVFDCNADGRPEIFAAGGTAPAILLRNETAGAGGALSFARAPVQRMTGVTGAYPLDVDGDGLLDLVVLRIGANRLLRGTGDCRFEDATRAWGFDAGDGWSTAFSATWEGAALRPTLAIGNYVDRANLDGPFGACDDNELHRPRGLRYAAPIPLRPGYCALSMLFSDWQRAGTAELRISNDRHYYLQSGHEEMWRLSPLAPRREADGWQRISIWGMGIASADLNGDGYPEVMLTSMGDQLLQINEAGALSNAPFEIGTYAQRPHVGDDGRPSTGWHAEFADVDNDGDPDLFIAKGNVDQMPSNAIRDPNNLLLQGADGRFAEAAAAAGVASDARARGAALADFDGDGRLDLVVANRRAPLELWQNVTPQTGAWAAVDLRAPAPNTRAVGAWIEVRTKAHLQTREVTVGGGHAGGQAGPVHFGLGAAEAAQVRVRWPVQGWSDWRALPLGQVSVLHPDGVSR